MGTWSTQPFGNDAAMDWFQDLESSHDADAFLLNALDTSNAEDEHTEAAAALVAGSAFTVISGLPKLAREWVENKGYVPSQTTISKAIDALTRILDQSELKDLWEEGGSIKSWEKNTTKILDRLLSAKEAPQIQRNPKKRSIPRSLHKLLELYMLNPDPAIGSKILQKIQNLTDPNEVSKDTNFDLPLCLVAKAGLLEATEFLLAQGADPNRSSMIWQSTPLMSACMKGQIEVAEVLLSAGAKLFSETIIDDESSGCLDSRLHGKENPNPVLFRYSHAFWTAVRYGNPDTIDFLISKGCSIDQRDINGKTLLHMACSSGNTTNADHLIKLGIPINQGTHGDNAPAIFEAVRSSNYDTTKFLIREGANINALDSYTVEGKLWHDSPLDAAYLYKDQKMIDLLKSHGALTGDKIAEKAM